MKKIVFVLFMMFVAFSFVSCGELTPGGTTPTPTVKDDFSDYMNDYRIANSMPVFVENAVLTKVAQDWVDYQASIDQYLSHDEFQNRIIKAESLLGITLSEVGENCAWNIGATNPAWTAYDGLIHSPGHLANIRHFSACGVGVARSRSGTYYFCQFFTMQQ